MSTFTRVLVAVLLGVLILFPGVMLLRFVVLDVFGFYHELTLTDCLLVFVVILLCALLLQPRGETEKRVRPRADDPDLTLVGPKVPGQSRHGSRPPSTHRHGTDTRSHRDDR